MNFDCHTISLLYRRPDGPSLSDAEAAAFQDAHMAHLADLYDAGILLAAGPVASSDGSGGLCGFSILKVDPVQARELKERDPAVRAGIYRIEVCTWMLPAGLVGFSHGRLPRSMAEATVD
jgi:uncharacterized protein